MDTSLVINNKGELAFMYVGAIKFIPLWASLDVEMGEICIGGVDNEFGIMKLDKIDHEIYDAIKATDKIMLIGVDDTPERTPHEGLWVPLMVTNQIK